MHPNRAVAMPQPLTPAETSLLRQLSGPGITTEKGLDPPTLDALTERGLVLRLGGYVRLSPEGRTLLMRNGSGGPAASSHPVRRRPGGERPATHALPAPGAAPAPPSDAILPAAAPPAEPDTDLPDTTLNDRQEEMLRALVQHDTAVPMDDLDGRVIRALEGRGLVRRSEGRVEVTEEGRAFYDRRVRRRRRARAGYAHTAAAAPEAEADERRTRAQLMRNAVEALRRVVGDAEEIEVGDLNATAADALAALTELADRIERGDDPRRIVRAPGR